MGNSRNDQKPHVAFLPAPGMGHLIPVVEFAKRLDLDHGISATFIVPDFGFPMTSNKAFLNRVLPETMNVVYLPPPPPDSGDSLYPSAGIASRIAQAVTRCVPALRQELRILAESTRLVALFTSIIGTDAFEVAAELGIRRYVFNHLSAMTLSLFLYLPELHGSCSCPYGELTEPIQIPGCVPVRGCEMPDWVADRESPIYKSFVHNSKRYRLADGLIVNSFSGLERGAVVAASSALMDHESGKPKPPVYPVGPLLQTGATTEQGGECLTWLEQQPRGSVLYVCFGSSGTLSLEQLAELAMGLEMSGQRFIWAVRAPHEKTASATFFKGAQDPFDFLPKGFVDRTKESGLGLLVRSWAPQVKILGHEATGGFLTHAGWNSIVESVVNGMPLIAWPLFAEQEMHTVMVSDGLNVAIRAQKDGNGLVGREKIAKYVKDLMVGEEGKRIREKMRDLKDAAAMATGPGGTSTESLAELASILKKQEAV